MSIRRMDMASDSVMLMGNPSGTAITMIATETMKMCSTCCEMASQSPSSNPLMKIALPSMTQKIAMESTMPARPISFERRVSWRLSGVCSSLWTVACSVTRPASVASPTAVETITP